MKLAAISEITYKHHTVFKSMDISQGQADKKLIKYKKRAAKMFSFLKKISKRQVLSSFLNTSEHNDRYF